MGEILKFKSEEKSRRVSLLTLVDCDLRQTWV